MSQRVYSRITIRRPDGTVEHVGRPGLIFPADAVTAFQKAGHGTVLTVRHVNMPAGGRTKAEAGTHRVIAVHPVNQ